MIIVRKYLEGLWRRFPYRSQEIGDLLAMQIHTEYS
jgi:hypothetical protein